MNIMLINPIQLSMVIIIQHLELVYNLDMEIKKIQETTIRCILLVERS